MLLAPMPCRPHEPGERRRDEGDASEDGETGTGLMRLMRDRRTGRDDGAGRALLSGPVDRNDALTRRGGRHRRRAAGIRLRHAEGCSANLLDAPAPACAENRPSLQPLEEREALVAEAID